MEQKFIEWVAALSKKYRQSQIKAAVRINSELIRFYLELGKEIDETSFKKKYGNNFYKKLSDELKRKIQKNLINDNKKKNIPKSPYKKKNSRLERFFVSKFEVC